MTCGDARSPAIRTADLARRPFVSIDPRTLLYVQGSMPNQCGGWWGMPVSATRDGFSSGARFIRCALIGVLVATHNGTAVS